VKNVLSSTYPDTDMSGDGQVVLVRFESYSVEVVPAFLLTSGRYWICNTHDGGRYKETDPWAEVGHIDAVDQTTNNNLRPLIRMLKSWQY
jgi:Second Messenger Oligonucleotide or Dinucleotide Synthetase domain